MTREQILARIKALQDSLDAQKSDPLQSYSSGLAISAPILRELTSLQERLRAMDSPHLG